MKRPWLIVAVVAISAIPTAYAMTRIGAVPEPVVAPQGVTVPRPSEATLSTTAVRETAARSPSAHHLWNTYSTLLVEKFDRGLASVECIVLSRQYLHLAHLVGVAWAACSHPPGARSSQPGASWSRAAAREPDRGGSSHMNNRR